MKHINVSMDFTDTPGGRLKNDGKFTGEEFREKFLEKNFNAKSDEKIEINLDGTYGYATSFLEEAFGGLARQFGPDTVINRIIFISEEEPLLVDEIKNYIKNCCDNEK